MSIVSPGRDEKDGTTVTSQDTCLTARPCFRVKAVVEDEFYP